MTTNPVFLSCNKKNIFLMDPRIGKNTSIIASKSKIYSSNNYFTCMNSSKNGTFALGAEDGAIRLYKEVG